MDIDQADLFALGCQVIDGFLAGFRTGAHHDDDPVCVGSAVVIVEVIIPAGQLIDFLHVMFHRFG